MLLPGLLRVAVHLSLDGLSLPESFLSRPWKPVLSLAALLSKDFQASFTLLLHGFFAFGVVLHCVAVPQRVLSVDLSWPRGFFLVGRVKNESAGGIYVPLFV